MRPLALFLAIALATTSIAAPAQRRLPFQIVLEVSYGDRDGCRIALFQSTDEAPYRRQIDRTFNLPREQRQLAEAIPEMGYDDQAQILGGADIPETCSGYAFDAVRPVSHHRVGFWFPPSTRPDAPVENASICDVATDPARFRGRRIRVRGPVRRNVSPDDITYWMIDTECQNGFLLTNTNAAIWQEFTSNGQRAPVIVMTVTGTPGISSCFRIPPGTSCGASINIERFEDVDRPGLCWGYRRIDQNHSVTITEPCPRAELTPHQTNGTSAQRARR